MVKPTKTVSPRPAARAKVKAKKPAAKPSPAKRGAAAKPAPKKTPKPVPKPPPAKPRRAAEPAKPPPAESSRSADDYTRRKEAARARNADIALTGRDIGAVPDVADPARRAACGVDLERFLTTYFPRTFYLAFCDDQRKAIVKAQRAILEGQLFALAMPRGMGKTAICEAACLWGLIYGHCSFALLLAANGVLAQKSLDSIKAELETNELLGADFPEVCFPIAKLESIANRCKGQLSNGQPTRIVWTNRRLVLPTIAGSKASGAALHCCGILSGVRGLTHKTADGRTVRPDVFIGDDLQTDQTAVSPSQCEKRLRVLLHSVLGLAGPDRCIAGLVPCTVMRAGDVADTLLDHVEHPEFQGERCKLLYAMPVNKEMWSRYAELREASLNAGEGITRATEFYRANRAAMDEGAVAAWPERFLAQAGQISAVQYAMELFIADPARFAAEYQNDPLQPEAAANELTPEGVAARANGLGRRVTPVWATKLTAAIDVQRYMLFYTVIAWADDFTGHVLDYGACPQQRRAYYTYREAHPTLESLAPNAGLEAQLRAGLDLVADELLGREWEREGAPGLKIGKCLVDANWGDSTNTVYEFCRRSRHAALLTPSHGKGIGASSNPLNQGRGKLKPGEEAGLHWFVPIPQSRAKSYVLFDANFYKSFVAARLQVPAGGRGRLDLFGHPADHRLYADHLTAERGELVTHAKSGRQVAEWRLKQVGRDNHWLDTTVLCAVGASMLKVKLVEMEEAKPQGPAPRRRTMAEMRADAERRAGR